MDLAFSLIRLLFFLKTLFLPGYTHLLKQDQRSVLSLEMMRRCLAFNGQIKDALSSLQTWQELQEIEQATAEDSYDVIWEEYQPSKKSKGRACCDWLIF